MNSKEISQHDQDKISKFLITDRDEIEKKVNGPVRRLLEVYSGVEGERVVDHVVGLVSFVWFFLVILVCWFFWFLFFGGFEFAVTFIRTMG